MKKALLLSISFLCFQFTAISQNGYSISPEIFDESFEEDLDNVTYLRLDALMENSSDTTININWEIINIDLPIEWGLSVSDKDMSYPPGPQITTTNASPLAFFAGEVNIPFNIHIYHNQKSGCGVFDVVITLDESSVILDTINYKISVNDSDCVISAVDNHHIEESVDLFPNPFVNNLEIKTESHIKYITIYNLQGDALMTQLNNFQNLDVSNLESGIYFMKIVSAKGYKVIKKIVKV